MLKYIFVVAKSTQKIVFLLTPAGIGDFKSVIRISPSYKNKTTKKKQSSCTYSKPFYHGKTIKQRVTAPLPWDIQPGFWTPRLKQHVLKHGKPNTPEHVNWITQTERKNEYFTDWVGVSVYLFVCFFFHFTDCQACWSFPGALPVFPCIPRKRVRMGFTA